MKGRNARLLAGILMLAALALASIARIEALDGMYPHSDRTFSMGQEVPVEMNWGTEQGEQHIAVTSVAFLDEGQVQRLQSWALTTTPERSCPALLVTVRSEDADLASLVSLLRLMTGPCAWAPDQQISASLYYQTGDLPGKSEFDFVFLLSPETCSDAVWASPTSHEYELVCSLWPTRKAVELGRPAAGALPSLD